LTTTRWAEERRAVWDSYLCAREVGPLSYRAPAGCHRVGE
jgi:hypothetical protein